MKAVIELDVQDWQIGQDVTVYFPDTMLKHGKCELLKEQEAVVRCKDCRWAEVSNNEYTWCGHVDDGFCHNNDWFCADGEKRE